MVSTSTAHAMRTVPAMRPLRAMRRRLLTAAFATVSVLSPPGQAQGIAGQMDCRAGNIQRVDELLQALSEARARRSSISFALKLLPVEAQLKSVKSTHLAEPPSAEQCQVAAAQIDAQRSRLARLIPDLQAGAAPPAPVAGAPGAPAALPAAPPVAAAWAPADQPVPAGACSTDNEQTRSDLAQRFVHFMQMARIPPSGMAPYQSFARRLSTTEANMVARPDDCAAHGAALAQSQTELQQLMAMEARMAPAAGTATPGGAGPLLDGTMPLLALPSTESCIADLRLGFRFAQQAASDIAMSLPDGPGRAQAQQLANSVVQQQILAFGRSPLSPEACEQSRQSLGQLRASLASSIRNGASLTAGRPAAPDQAPAGVPPPRTAAMAAPVQQQPAAQRQPAQDNDFLDCVDTNRSLFSDLEREGNRLKASGRPSRMSWPDFAWELDMYRQRMRHPMYVMQCPQVGRQLEFHLALLRKAAADAQAAPAAQSQPVAGQARPAAAPATLAPQRVAQPEPVPVSPVATSVPPAGQGRPMSAPPSPPPPARPAAVAVTPSPQRAQVAAAAPPQAPPAKPLARPPAPKPAEAAPAKVPKPAERVRQTGNAEQ